MWIKLDDGFATHPKLVAAGPLALAIQVRAICYSGRYLTDGFLPDGVVSSLFGGMDHIGITVAGVMGSHGKPIAEFGEEAKDWDWPDHMVEYGLWEKVEGGYQIHDYLDWNLSKKQVQEWKKKQSSGGKKGMKTRWNQSVKSVSRDITQAITHHISHRTGQDRTGLGQVPTEFSSLVSDPDSGKKEANSSNLAAAQNVSKKIPRKGQLTKVLAEADKYFPPIH